MTRKKDSVSLFEVIAKGRSNRPQAGMDVPAWMDQQDTAPPAGGEPAGEDSFADVPDERETPPPPSAQYASDGGAPARASGSVSPYAPVWNEPTIARDGNRIRVAVTDATAVLVALGLVGVIVLAFLVGRWTKGSHDGPAEAGMTVTTGDEQTSDKRQGAGGGTRGAHRIVGKYYLVVQDLREYRPDSANAREQSEAEEKLDAASDIQDWLAERGIRTTLNTTGPDGQKRLVVWSTQAFDSPRSEAAKRFARTIEDLGRRYMASNPERRYDFRQRRDGQFDPMFIKKTGGSR
ncbi:MAG: hypothetical protein KGY99_04425 [Phycisphaerae bacterium]|nr:hypothetical protein [Phycisphaerae bacterium]